MIIMLGLNLTKGPEGENIVQVRRPNSSVVVVQAGHELMEKLLSEAVGVWWQCEIDLHRLIKLEGGDM